MVKEFFFPKIDKEVVELMDKSSMKSIKNISIIVAVFESIALSVFILTRENIGGKEWLSIYSVLFCILTCLAGYFFTKFLLKKDSLDHIQAVLLNSLYYSVMSIWAMWSSYAKYVEDEQILTFYAVEVMLVCFIALRPWLSTLFTLGTYTIQFAIFMIVDGADGINVINYFILTLVSAIGMCVRYHSLHDTSEAAIKLQKSKDSEIREKMDILRAIADIYDKVNLIDFVENTEMSVRDTVQVKRSIDLPTQTHTILSTKIRERVMPDQLEKFIAFTDLTTVRSRLVGKRLISDDFVDVVDGWFKAQYIPIDVDENDVPYRIVFTTRNVEDEKQREESLIRIAMTDELTRLFNRRSYEEDLLAYQQQGLKKNFVIFSADVNGLKKVNDTVGHVGGDELIKGAADCLLHAIRNKGKVYRTGGDEFAILINTDDPQEICREIEEYVTAWHGKYSESLSISLGYASYAENEGLDIHELEKKADSEMYKSKTRYYEKKGIDRRVSTK
ncbi:MAG: GGDEF domain-containing protein [Lachnospiraceae bacterium]|nr:GGDEF domain-containing protein [Lachnospiraceae bacterium]